MNRPRCPGQDMRYLKPEDVFGVRCPCCKTEVEFFKDEPSLRCPACGHQVRNPRIDLGCAKWCALAEQCLATAPHRPDEIKSLCERLVAEMQAALGADPRRIGRALKVLEQAEMILGSEAADPLIVKAAAILHDIDANEARRKHGSSRRSCRETQGAAIARAILEKLGIDENRIDQICRIVGSHGAGDIDTPESRIVRDAVRAVKISEE